MAIRILQGAALLTLLLTVIAKEQDVTNSPSDETMVSPKYEYGYVVSNKEGSRQGHVESRDGEFALGKYYVDLPDGSGQRVTYFADTLGYHPLVTYQSTSPTGTTRTAIAMGEKAVTALKESVSTMPTLPSVTPPSVELTGVQVVNAGSSGITEQNVVIKDESSTAPTIITNELPTTVKPPAPYYTPSYESSTSSPVSVPEYVVTSTTPHVPVSHFVNPIPVSNSIDQDYKASAIYSSPSPIYRHPVASSLSTFDTTLPTSTQVRTEKPRSFSSISSIDPVKYSHQTVSTFQVDTKTPTPSVYTVTPSLFDHIKTHILSTMSQSGEANTIVTPTDNTQVFSHAGKNVKITSYVADTNKVLDFDERTENPQTLTQQELNDLSTEQKIIDDIQEQTKRKILRELQGEIEKQTIVELTSVSPRRKVSRLRPIVVTDTSTTPVPLVYTVTVPAASLASASVVSSNNGESGYQSVLSSTTPFPSTTAHEALPTPEPLVSSHSPIVSNSVNIVPDDKLFVLGSTLSPVVITPRFSVLTSELLAPLQAGISLSSQPPSQAEENKPSYNTVDEEVGPREEQIATKQFQTLGYEQRLVNPEAQKLVQETNPVLQEQQTQNLLLRQELELLQVQRNIQDLQKKITDEIDQQHAEEQRKQEQENNQETLAYSTQTFQQPTQTILLPTDQALIQNVINGHAHYVQQQHVTTEHPVHASGEDIRIPYNYEFLKEQRKNSIQVQSLGQQGVIQKEVVAVVYPTPQPDTSLYLTSRAAVEEPDQQTPVTVTPLPAHQTQIYGVSSTVATELDKSGSEQDQQTAVTDNIPLEYTKVAEVEKPLSVPHPYPIEITKLVHVETPIAIPTPYAVAQPIPLPFPVPHAISVPYPQLLAYPEPYPVPMKEYHPVFIHGKPAQHKPNHIPHLNKPIKRPDYKDMIKEYKYNLETYHTIPLHLKTSHSQKHYHALPPPPSAHFHSKGCHPWIVSRNKNVLKNLRIEYGFKPPLIPSVEIKEEPKPSIYGEAVKSE